MVKGELHRRLFPAYKSEGIHVNQTWQIDNFCEQIAQWVLARFPLVRYKERIGWQWSLPSHHMV
jgi:hypothetical protein